MRVAYAIQIQILVNVLLLFLTQVVAASIKTLSHETTTNLRESC